MSQIEVIYVPQDNANDDKSTLLEWYVESGEEVEVGQAIAEMENAKSSFEVHSEHKGFLFYMAEPKTKFKTGEALACVCGKSDDTGWQKYLGEKKTLTQNSLNSSGPKVSAKAFKLMQSYGLELEQFKHFDTVKLADVEEYLEKNPQDQDKQTESKESGFNPLELNSTKLYEKKLLRQSWQQIIPSSVSVQIDLKKALAYEESLKKVYKGVNLGEVIAYEAVQQLKTFTNLNAFCENGKTYAYENITLGFAVNLGKGLKVPVVEDSQDKDLGELSLALKDLSLRYIKDTLTSEFLRQSSFTITNLYSLGVQHFIPVVNYRQSAILGICSPDFNSNYFQLVMSFDHQLSDGMEAALFLNNIKKKLEQ